MTITAFQDFQTSSGLSQQDSQGNENISSAYSLPAYPLIPYPKVPETRDCSPSVLEASGNLVHITECEARLLTRLLSFAPSALETSDNLAHTTGRKARPVTKLLGFEPLAPALCHYSPNLSLSISSKELQRVLDSLLDQVDWLEVAVKVAKNRAPAVYCNAIEKILLAHIHQLVKAEGEGDEVGKVKNGKDDKEHMCVYEGDDEDEDNSEFSRNSEESEDCGEDDNNSENMQTDEDESDGEYEEDEMDENGYDC